MFVTRKLDSPPYSTALQKGSASMYWHLADPRHQLFDELEVIETNDVKQWQGVERTE